MIALSEAAEEMRTHVDASDGSGNGVICDAMTSMRRLAFGPLILCAVIATKALAAQPARIAVVVDTSAGTSNAIPQIRTGVAAAMDTLPSDYEVLLVTTGRRGQVRVPPTTDRAKLKSSASSLTSDGGPTPLMDTLREVDDRFFKKLTDRTCAFILITGDGTESSKDTDADAFNRWLADISKRGVLADAVVLKTTGSGLPEVIATSLAKATGGHYAVTSSGNGLPDAIDKLAAQLAADAARPLR